MGGWPRGIRICRLLCAAILVPCIMLRLPGLPGGRADCQGPSGELIPSGSSGEGINYRSLSGMVVPPSDDDGDDDDDDDDDDDGGGGWKFSMGLTEDKEPSPAPAPAPAPAPVPAPVPVASVQRPAAAAAAAPVSSASDDLRAAAFAGDKNSVADVLTRTSSVSMLIRGLQFEPQDRSAAVRKTVVREGDPDVAVMKGLAQASLNYDANILKLAQAMSGAVSTGLFGRFRITATFYRLLRDRPLMIAILQSNPATDFLPATGRRRLQCDGCTPVNSFVCASCWPSATCSPMFWCP